MPRTPAKITQADVARAIRAAKACGAGLVEIRPDGTIVIPLSQAATSVPEIPHVDEEEVLVL